MRGLLNDANIQKKLRIFPQKTCRHVQAFGYLCDCSLPSSFTFDDYETELERNDFLHTIKLKNQYGSIFYDKLTFVYLEMPNFMKAENALESRLDKWLYFIKNLEDFQDIPATFNDEVFEQAFEKAAIARLGQEDLYQYEMSLKVYRDYKNTVVTAYDIGKIEGKLEGKLEGEREERLKTARQAKAMNLPIADIMALTGLSEAEISNL